MALIRGKQLLTSPKDAVRLATTAALAANTYANGVAGPAEYGVGGVGATLTGNANGALAAIDGVAPATGDPILVNNEAAALKNGVYIVTVLGTAGTPYVLTRRSTDDTNVKLAGSSVAVELGTANAGTLFVLPRDPTLVVGTTALNYVRLSAGGSVPQVSNKRMTALVTAADFAQATATAIAVTPAGVSYVGVGVNGAWQNVGNGVRTFDCYFSGDGGATARAFGAIVAGDLLYWVGSVAGFQLSASDLIDFFYDA